tara:strand:+ start:30 stop:263 length:234 start_codon:yes stop_codon:yes gene_type:complete
MNTDLAQERRTQQQFDSLPNSAFVRLPMVATLYATSQSNVWRWMERGIVPRSRKLAGRTTAWNVGELRQSLKEIGLR